MHYATTENVLDTITHRGKPAYCYTNTHLEDTQLHDGAEMFVIVSIRYV